MLFKLTQDLKNGFAPWKSMLHENGHKLKEHGLLVFLQAQKKTMIIN